MSTQAPLDSSELTSTCTSVGQQAIMANTCPLGGSMWQPRVRVVGPADSRVATCCLPGPACPCVMVVPVEIRPGPVSKSGPIQNCCGAGPGRRKGTKGRKFCASTRVRTRAKTSAAVAIYHYATQVFSSSFLLEFSLTLVLY